jgi:hypothetical protein
VGIGAPSMAKAKSSGKDKPDQGAKTIGFRVTAEYALWLQDLARHYRTTNAGVIDRALAEWTEAQGYPVRPPMRTP